MQRFITHFIHILLVETSLSTTNSPVTAICVLYVLLVRRVGGRSRLGSQSGEVLSTSLKAATSLLKGLHHSPSRQQPLSLSKQPPLSLKATTTLP